MDEGKPKQHTPEEIARIEKSRTLSDAELLKGGAEYAIDDLGNKTVIDISEDQIEKIKLMYRASPEILKQIAAMESENIKPGDKVWISGQMSGTSPQPSFEAMFLGFREADPDAFGGVGLKLRAINDIDKMQIYVRRGDDFNYIFNAIEKITKL